MFDFQDPFTESQLLPIKRTTANVNFKNASDAEADHIWNKMGESGRGFDKPRKS